MFIEFIIMFTLTNNRQEMELGALMKMAVTAMRGDDGGGALLLVLLLGRLGVVGDEAFVVEMEYQTSGIGGYGRGAAAALREEAMEIDSLG